jgi:hypothetical protein
MSDQSPLDMDLRETVLVRGRPFLLEVRRASDNTIVRRTRVSVDEITIVVGLVDKQEFVDKQVLV